MKVSKKKFVKPKTTIKEVKEKWKQMVKDENAGKIIISSKQVQRDFSLDLNRLDTEVVVVIKHGVIQSIKVPAGISVIEHNYDTDGVSSENRPVKMDKNKKQYALACWN